jgi:signal peptidase
VILGLIGVLGAASLILLVITLVGGYQPFIVSSGSMEPTLPVGSLVMTKQVGAGDIKPGDIISVQRTDTDGLVTHRVQSIEADQNGRYSVVLRGDANNEDDPQPYHIQAAQLYQWQLPYVGSLITLIRNHVLIAVGVIAAALIVAFWDRNRTSITLPNGQVLDDLSKSEAKRVLATVSALGGAATVVGDGPINSSVASPAVPGLPEDSQSLRLASSGLHTEVIPDSA